MPRRAGRAFGLAALVCGTALAGEAVPSREIYPEARILHPRIGLALSGGGARGIAHLGVLRVLEEQRIPIDYIAGTSMGSIIGGLYASGLSPDQIRDALKSVDWNDLFNDRPPRRDLIYRRKEDDSSDLIKLEMGLKDGRLLLPRGLVAGQKIGFVLQSMTLHAAGIREFDRLPIPFRAVATDLGNGEMVVLDHGHLADALRASMSIPGAVAPMEIDGHLLADGGLVRNLPVDVVRAMGADIVIAFDTSTPLLSPEQLRSLPNITSQVTGMLTRENVEDQLKNADVAIVPDLATTSAGAYVEGERILELGAEAARAQTGELAPYALPEEEYRQRLARLHANLPEPPQIDAVEVQGADRVDPRIIRRRIRTEPGRPLDVEILKQDIARIYELGDFERVDYVVDPDGEKTKLVIRAQEKPWGPNYLRFGLNLLNDFEGDTDFIVISRLTATRLNALGAEWRTDLSLGETRRISTEFYQPLDFSSVFFVAPSLDYQNAIVDVFDGDDRIAEFQTKGYTGSLALGAQLGRFGEARAGITGGRLRARSNVGTLTLPTDEVSTAAYAGRVVVDRLDDPNFPHTGRRGLIDAYLARTSLGSDVSYDRVQGGFVQILPRRRHHVYLGIEGGTNLGSEIPFYDLFSLGGLFSFSGFKEGQLRGQLYGVARLGYYRRSGRLSSLTGRGIYVGGWAEAGNVWQSSRDISVDDLHYSGTLVFGADTFFGPLYLAYGHADGGHDAMYLSLGRSIGGRRLFGLGH